MSTFTVVSTVTHRSLMNKSKHDLARWVLHLLDCRDEDEDQLRADERVPDLLEAPARVRFISAEPLLGPLDLRDIHDGINCLNRRSGTCVDWVIVGGESGNAARPMHPDWVRALRNQCARAGVPFFFKQWGTWGAVYDRDVEDPDWRLCGTVERSTPRGRWLNLSGGHGFHGDRVIRVDRIGKKRAGRMLDGVEHNGMPKA